MITVTISTPVNILDVIVKANAFTRYSEPVLGMDRSIHKLICEINKIPGVTPILDCTSNDASTLCVNMFVTSEGFFHIKNIWENTVLKMSEFYSLTPILDKATGQSRFLNLNRHCGRTTWSEITQVILYTTQPTARELNRELNRFLLTSVREYNLRVSSQTPIQRFSNKLRILFTA